MQIFIFIFFFVFVIVWSKFSWWNYFFLQSTWNEYVLFFCQISCLHALLFPTARIDWIVEQCDLKELNFMSWRMSPQKLICFDLLKNSHHALLLPTARPHTNWIVKQCENEKKLSKLKFVRADSSPDKKLAERQIWTKIRKLSSPLTYYRRNSSSWLYSSFTKLIIL